MPDGFLEFLKKHAVKIGMEIDDEDFVVGKTIPLTKEQIAQYKELTKAGDIAEQARDKHLAMHKVFWANIQLSQNCFDSMRINEDTNELEIAAKDKPKKAVKSPFFQKG